MRAYRTSYSRLKYAGLIVFAFAVLLKAQSIRFDHYLDIPGQARSSIPAGSFFPRHALVSLGHSPPSPLSLTLVSVDIADLAYGDYFTFEVLIENTSREPVILPWSPDAGAFAQPVRRMPEGFLSGFVSLRIESEDDQQSTLALLDGQPLYGSSEVLRSLLTLAPGRTALLRVPAQMSATMQVGRANILEQPDGVVRLRAGFSLSSSTGPPIGSTNTLPIRVRPRELR